MSKSPNSVLDAGKKPRVKRRNAKWTSNLAKRAKVRVFGNTKKPVSPARKLPALNLPRRALNARTGSYRPAELSLRTPLSPETFSWAYRR